MNHDWLDEDSVPPHRIDLSPGDVASAAAGCLCVAGGLLAFVFLIAWTWKHLWS